MESENLVFTRYLYIEKQVKHSLLLSILNKDIQQSLFWAFELYYSYLSQEMLIIEYLLDIYKTMYEKNHPALRNLFTSYVTSWEKDDNPAHFANIVCTLCTRSYDLELFCKTYFEVEGDQQTIKSTNFIVNVPEKELNMYNQSNETVLPRNVLKQNCKYKVNTTCNSVFDLKLPNEETIKNAYYYNWIYYASRLPLWEDRILKCNGVIDETHEKVVFNNDEDLEMFYQKYGYEPDEQSVELQSKFMGIPLFKEQLSLDNFCDKFHFTLKIIKNVNNITYTVK